MKKCNLTKLFVVNLKLRAAIWLILSYDTIRTFGDSITNLFVLTAKGVQSARSDDADRQDEDATHLPDADFCSRSPTGQVSFLVLCVHAA